MAFDAQRLYEMLPAIVRIRDGEQGEPLRALADLIASEIAVLEENLEQLHDDQFIETCADWVVPYIGDLIGWEPLHAVSPKLASPRAEVANTITYRRCKGSAAVLEQLARDVTGWPSRVVEYFELLATTQYLNHPRLHNHVTPDLRCTADLLRLGSAFDPIPRTVEVRRPCQGGRWNIPHIGIHLWRIGAFPATRWPAARVDERRFRVSPLGQDLPLYARPLIEDTITHLAEPINVPEPLHRRLIARDPDPYYGRDKSLCLWVDDAPIPSEKIRFCDLADGGTGWANAPGGDWYAIDPQRGRIYLPQATGSEDLKVTMDFHYGSAAALGGGEYDREVNMTTLTQTPIRLVAGDALGDALKTLYGNSEGGVIEIEDSGVFTDAGNVGFRLQQKAHGELRSANRRRAVINGGLLVEGQEGAVATLDGLLITDSPVQVPETEANQLSGLILRHCTLVPGLALHPDGSPRHPDLPSLLVKRSGMDVVIEHCILGAIRATRGARLTLRNCILDATDPSLVAFCGDIPPSGPGPMEAASVGGTLTLENCTVIGRIYTERLDSASNTLFIAALETEGDGIADAEFPLLYALEKQSGCVRFSSLPAGPIRLPRAYRCQPATAVQVALARAQRDDPMVSQAHLNAIKEEVMLRTQPLFVSRRYGDPGYGLLQPETDWALLTGADNGSEIGVMNQQFHAQRLSNLQTRLREYLRFGLQAGVFYADERVADLNPSSGGTT